jgi:hypothetical protein
MSEPERYYHPNLAKKYVNSLSIKQIWNFICLVGKIMYIYNICSRNIKTLKKKDYLMRVCVMALENLCDHTIIFFSRNKIMNETIFLASID